MAIVTAVSCVMPMSSDAAVRCRAIDGDTLQCGHDRVRLQSVYAAEHDEAGGSSAKRNLQQRIDSGDVEVRKRGRDRYGRVLADVYVNGRKVDQTDVGPVAGRGTPKASPGRAAVKNSRLRTVGQRERKPAVSKPTARSHSTKPRAARSKKR